MTSANVTYYRVYRNGVEILKDHQHHLCKNWINEKLYAIDKPEECTLVTIWLDEYECPHEKEYNLGEYLAEDTRRKLELKDSLRFFQFLKKQGYNLEQIQSMGTIKKSILRWKYEKELEEQRKADTGAV